MRSTEYYKEDMMKKVLTGISAAALVVFALSAPTASADPTKDTPLGPATGQEANAFCKVFAETFGLTQGDCMSIARADPKAEMLDKKAPAP